MEKHHVCIQRSEAKNQRAQAVVERVNSILSESLYSHQYAQEMLLENERSRELVKRLPKVLKAMNSQPKRITGKEPNKPVQLEEVDVKNVKYNRPVGLDEVRSCLGKIMSVNICVDAILEDYALVILMR